MAVDEGALIGLDPLECAVWVELDLAQAYPDHRSGVHEWIAPVLAQVSGVDDRADTHDLQAAGVGVAVTGCLLPNLVVSQRLADVDGQNEPAVVPRLFRGHESWDIAVPVHGQVGVGAGHIPGLAPVDLAQVTPGVRPGVVVRCPDGDRDGPRVGIGLGAGHGVGRLVLRDERQDHQVSVGVCHGRRRGVCAGAVGHCVGLGVDQVECMRELRSEASDVSVVDRSREPEGLHAVVVRR